MTSALVTTPMAADANSYVSLAEADAYFADRLHSEVWEAATSTNKTKALLMAARVLDTRVEWLGDKTVQEQAMEWPRIAVPDGSYRNTRVFLDERIVPKFIKDAQCEQAQALLSGDTSAESETAGISKLSVGPIDLQFDKSDRAPVLVRQVRDLISGYGYAEGSKRATVKLERA